MGGSDNDNKSITSVGSDDSSCGNEGSRRRFHDSGIPRSVSTRQFDESFSSRSELPPQEALLDSITLLGQHVPECVMSACIEEVRNGFGNHGSADFTRNGDADAVDRGHRSSVVSMLPPHMDEMLPYVSQHEAALLFVDISGFTKLSIQMDVESLSKVINGYFQMLVNEVRLYGGDILKFAGDAFFAEWKATPSGAELEECVAIAAECAASIVAKFSDCPVYYPQDSLNQISTINCHCGLGVGELTAGHFGNSSRREFLIIGEPIDQVASAERNAGHGEVWASPDFVQTLSNDRHIHENAPVIVSEEKLTLLAARSTKYFCETEGTSSESTSAPIREITETMRDRCKDMELTELEGLRRCISLYVHSVVVADDPASASRRRSSDGGRDHVARRRPSTSSAAQKRHVAEAELRSVLTIFVRPLVNVKICGNEDADNHVLNTLNDIMVIASSVLDSCGGHLRQFIVDDKGVVLIANFGLRGSTFPRMVQERALPAARSIHFSLETSLGIESKIGCTLGNAYCGVIGGVQRHEFAVLGPSVNLAARLMIAPENRGVLVDDSVRLRAGKEFSFDALPPVKAKGYDNAVQIFEPLTSKERRWGKLDRHFVGRDEEMNVIADTATEIAEADESKASKIILISGGGGQGKSSLLVQSLAVTRKLLRVRHKQVIVTRNIGKEGDAIVPFSIFRSIFLDVLAELESSDREESVASSAGPLKSVAGSASHVSYRSFESNASTYHGSLSPSKTQSAIERLQYVAEELNAPPEFMLVVGHHLLGLQTDKLSKKGPAGSKLALDAIVDFMAQAFVRCTSHADLVVLALDDAQYLDSLSWRLVQEMHQRAENLLIVCASRDSIVQKFNWASSFQEIDVPPLSSEEIKELIAKKLGCFESDIDPELARSVCVQCSGVPTFALEVIKSMRKKDLLERGENGLFTMKPFHFNTSPSSLDDLILHQIDSLDVSIRSILQVAAILGLEFCLSEVTEVAARMNAVPEETISQLRSDLLDAFAVAVKEGILGQTFEGQTSNVEEEKESGDADDTVDQTVSELSSQIPEDRTYSFAHAVWRDNILGVLLESRKKEIHLNVALVLESKDDAECDLQSNLRLFRHRKESGDSSTASNSALAIGQTLENIGFHEQAIEVLEDALSIWRIDSKTPTEKDNFGGVVSSNSIESASAIEIENMIRLLIALGKVLANIHRGKESAAKYNAAISIIQSAPASKDLEDRTFIFPCFSGLFVSLKFGDIQDDDSCTYEKNLVKKFVDQAKLNGDPIHYSRALAMQGETYGRLGEYEKAFASHRELESIYDPDKHSAGVCKAYGSDRSAQSYAHSTRWKMMVGDPDGALKTCRYIVEDLMPKMEERNVHNSCMMLWPVLWAMKDMGLALEARAYFDRFVVMPFKKHFGDGGSTWALATYEPTLMLLHLSGHQDDGDMDKGSFAKYTAWALDMQNMEFSSGLNGGMSAFSRDVDSIAAEICLLLAKRRDEGATRHLLVQNGLILAEKSAERCRKKIAAYGQILPVYEQLEHMK